MPVEAELKTVLAGGSTPSFALALGGGGARGLAHIHVVETLDELGIRPVAIAGSSIGAIVGAGMAAGMRGTDIRDYAGAILGNRGEVMSRIWQARPNTLAEFMETGIRVSQFNLERILAAFLPPVVPETFEQLVIPLRVTATDYYAHELAVLEKGDLRSAIAASAAIPAVFRPVRRDGRLYIDGGIYNPVPFDLLRGVADVVIAVDVVGGPEPNGRKMPTSIDLMFGATQLMMQSITDMKLRSDPPAIMLRPPVSHFRVMDFLKINQVLAGTIGIRDELKRGIEAVMNAHARA